MYHPMAFLANRRRARAFYRVLSPIYDVVNPFVWTKEMRAQAMDAFDICPSDRVLDLGCGTGFATTALCEHADTVIGLDQSAPQLARAKRKLGERVPLVRGDAHRLPYRDDSFDAVWSSGSIEYWPSPERVLAECRRLVRPGGPVLVVGPHEPSLWPFRVVATAIMRFYPAEQATAWFESAGLERVENFTVGPWYDRDLAIVTQGWVPD